MNTISKRSVTREKGNRYCTVTVELRDQPKGVELSITAVAGRIMKRPEAKRESLQYWINYFDDCPGEIMEINKRFNKRFTSSRGAARFVLECDGEFHGLDVTHQDGEKVYTCDSAGQCWDEIREFFPEVGPMERYHLNGMHGECEHQEARGETWKTHADAVCPQCGYKLGSAWLHRKLPAAVEMWARTFSDETPVPEVTA